MEFGKALIYGIRSGKKIRQLVTRMRIEPTKSRVAIKMYALLLILPRLLINKILPRRGPSGLPAIFARIF